MKLIFLQDQKIQGFETNNKTIAFSLQNGEQIGQSYTSKHNSGCESYIILLNQTDSET